jgi:uncharacterized protein YfaS (alpha-2-macroglobulin family)
VRDTLSPDLTLLVKAGDDTLLTGVFTSPTSPVVSVTSASIPSDPISFIATGKGEASVVVGASFIPAKVSPDPIYRGIFLEKSIKRVDFISRKEQGPGLLIVERGALLAVTIQLTTPDDLQAVTLTDLLSGGLEAEVPQRGPVADPPSPQVMPDFFEGMLSFGRVNDFRPSPRCFWGYCPSFGGPNITVDRVQWKASNLNAGSHTVTYYVYANTPGTWNLPPAKASVDAQPELMGLTGGGKFVVTREEATAEEQAKLLAANGISTDALLPKECQEECGDMEQCDVRSGTCINAAPF